MMHHVVGNKLGKDSAKVFMHEGSAPRRHLGAGSMPMLLVVLENWKAEPDQSFVRRARNSSAGRRHRQQQLMDTARQEVVFVAKVGVEGRSADVRAVQDLSYDDRVVVLLVHNRHGRVAQKLLTLRT